MDLDDERASFSSELEGSDDIFTVGELESQLLGYNYLYSSAFTDPRNASPMDSMARLLGRDYSRPESRIPPEVETEKVLHIMFGKRSAGKSTLCNALLDPAHLLLWGKEDGEGKDTSPNSHGLGAEDPGGTSPQFKPDDVFTVDENFIGTTICSARIDDQHKLVTKDRCHHYLIDTPGINDDNLEISSFISRLNAANKKKKVVVDNEYPGYFPPTPKDNSEAGKGKSAHHEADMIYLHGLVQSHGRKAKVGSVNIAIESVYKQLPEETCLANFIDLLFPIIKDLKVLNIFINRQTGSINSFFMKNERDDKAVRNMKATLKKFPKKSPTYKQLEMDIKLREQDRFKRCAADESKWSDAINKVYQPDIEKFLRERWAKEPGNVGNEVMDVEVRYYVLNPKTTNDLERLSTLGMRSAWLHDNIMSVDKTSVHSLPSLKLGMFKKTFGLRMAHATKVEALVDDLESKRNAIDKTHSPNLRKDTADMSVGYGEFERTLGSFKSSIKEVEDSLGCTTEPQPIFSIYIEGLKSGSDAAFANFGSINEHSKVFDKVEGENSFFPLTVYELIAPCGSREFLLYADAGIVEKIHDLLCDCCQSGERRPLSELDLPAYVMTAGLRGARDFTIEFSGNTPAAITGTGSQRVAIWLRGPASSYVRYSSKEVVVQFSGERGTLEQICHPRLGDDATDAQLSERIQVMKNSTFESMSSLALNKEGPATVSASACSDDLEACSKRLKASSEKVNEIGAWSTKLRSSTADDVSSAAMVLDSLISRVRELETLESALLTSIKDIQRTKEPSDQGSSSKPRGGSIGGEVIKQLDSEDGCILETESRVELCYKPVVPASVRSAGLLGHVSYGNALLFKNENNFEVHIKNPNEARQQRAIDEDNRYVKDKMNFDKTDPGEAILISGDQLERAAKYIGPFSLILEEVDLPKLFALTDAIILTANNMEVGKIERNAAEVNTMIVEIGIMRSEEVPPEIIDWMSAIQSSAELQTHEPRSHYREDNARGLTDWFRDLKNVEDLKKAMSTLSLEYATEDKYDYNSGIATFSGYSVPATTSKIVDTGQDDPPPDVGDTGYQEVLSRARNGLIESLSTLRKLEDDWMKMVDRLKELTSIASSAAEKRPSMGKTHGSLMRMLEKSKTKSAEVTVCVKAADLKGKRFSSLYSSIENNQNLMLEGHHKLSDYADVGSVFKVRN
jgi:hypothetical protein